MRDKTNLKIRLLQLRKLRLKSSFITCIDGDFTQKFTKPGVVKYVCTVHPGMEGSVVVGK